MKKSVVINIFLVLTAALLFFGSTYLIPTLLGTAIFSISLYFLSKIKSIKVVSVNLLILFIALFAIESFLISADTLKKFKKRNNKQIFTIIDRDTKKEINKSKSYIKILHEKLGYGPVPNAIINSKKIKEGKVVYDVDYTIDKKGHRIASNSAINKKFKKSVLFFGCSFTYGEGVKDNQSLPYVFNLKTNSKYNVANFGFSGYGVQQMLTILENDIERDVVINDKVDHVFYQAILDHINRAAFASYPKYALDENKLHFIKKETDIKNTDPESKNLILKKLVAGKKRDGSKINDQDRKLFLQIIRQSRDVVQEKYGAKFTVILWDLIKDNDELILENEYNLKYVTQALKDLNINYVLISDILSDYKNNPEQYTIKGDGHPSPLTHKKIAQYLAKNIGG